MPQHRYSLLGTNGTVTYQLRSMENKKDCPSRKRSIERSLSRYGHSDEKVKLSKQHSSKTVDRCRRDGTSVYSNLLNSTPKASSSNKSSPIKTRRLQKSKQRDISRCTICKSSKGDLDACTRCRKFYHISKCISYSPAMASRVKEVDWLCPKCIRCSVCKSMIDDPTNVECGNCLQAWHGSCKPEGSVLNRQWFCNICLKNSRLVELLKGDSDNIRQSVEDSERADFVALVPITSQLPNGENYETLPCRINTRSRMSRSPHHIARPCTPSTSHSYTSVIKDINSLKKNFVTDERFSSSDENCEESCRSPRKQPITKSDAVCSSSLIKEMFDKALKVAEIEALNKGNLKSDEQWVNLGGDTDIKVLYHSPYPDHIRSVPLFFVCAFCLKAFNDQCSFSVHRDCCTRITPPGIEIYRDLASALSFFEVDGAQERTYCRNLCLFAMLFISSKTLHIEVGTFFFYILTKNCGDGCRIVGYFSKEKNPSRNNNLSCLLTIPSEQRNGYGHLLIDMSYKLSEIERKVGSPEHPLSDLGLYTYRKYWKSSILCYLRSINESSSVSIKNISLHTRIHPTDIVNELLRNNLLVMKDSNYFIKTWKLAYKLPLSTLRRRVVDSSLIRWTPQFDVTKLDVFKLNHYA